MYTVSWVELDGVSRKYFRSRYEIPSKAEIRAYTRLKRLYIIVSMGDEPDDEITVYDSMYLTTNEMFINNDEGNNV